MKVAFNESLNWEKQNNSPNSMIVLPVNFSKEYLCIPKEYDKLIIPLRTAYANEHSLDKKQTSYSDSIDALRLACKMYKMN